MICQECDKQGLKSKVYGGDIGYTTAMYCRPYHDEDGKYHLHDFNTTSYGYECSNGHTFTRTIRKECPTCGDWTKVKENE